MTTPDFTTPVWQVRALIPDIEKVPNPNDPNGNDEYLFVAEHLQALLDLNNGSVRLAAADACEALGTSEGIIAKVIKTEDLQTDGAKLMSAFLARAKQLRARADREEALDDVDGFDIIPYHPSRGVWIG